ncbi:branched-chain amino acid ABC transporter permease [Piscinibacterium candidicorallinum]|jgi:branched-chain amino acid transport system permease protein|uniref:Branched-chain amino acid ABC transporter permease n=1 Tax=Piscinibacterium candidicorallinum TaxID=1793872 RepID=A0ABV7H3T3_9BURK
MEVLIQQIVNGLVLGSVYALIALGYTMVYGILQLINFAHGDVLMVGALTALSVIKLVVGFAPDTPGWTLMLIGTGAAIPVCMLLNVFIERVAYRPLRNAPRLAPLITAIGISIILQTVAMIVWGRSFHVVPQLLPAEPMKFGPIQITPTQLTVIIVSAVVMFSLVLLVEKTKLGRAMRATAENPRVAGLMGVDSNRVIVATFALGAALAAVAGVLFAANYYTAHFAMGFMPGLKAFTAAVLGGIGNIYGAVVGGLILGLVESIGAGYIGTWTGGVLGSHYQDIFAFVVLIIVLVFRPSGIMGERVADRA